MHIRYLGTGAAEGFPSIFCQCSTCSQARVEGGRNIRRRASVLIDDCLLVDLSPDLHAVCNEGSLNLSALRYLLITHPHADHFYAEELSNLRPPYCMQTGREKLKIFASPLVFDRMRTILGDDEMEKLEPFMELVPLTLFVSETVGDYTVTPLKPRHCPGAFIYLIRSPQGKTMLYANDTGFFPEETWDYLAGRPLDFVSMDCTNPMHSDTPNHMNLEDMLTVKRRLYQLKSATPRTRYMATHFSHTGGLLHRGLEERLRLYGIGVAYDGLEINLQA